MPRSARTVIGLLLGALPLTTGCVTEPGGTPFIVRIDSITAPASIASTDTLRMTYWGRVGPDGCSRLRVIEKRVTATGVEMTFRGERNRRGDCTLMPVSLEHADSILPPLQDPFTIRVVQPDGVRMERIVRVVD